MRHNLLRLLPILLLVIFSFGLIGCQNFNTGIAQSTKKESAVLKILRERSQNNNRDSDLDSAGRYWGAEQQANPENAEIAVEYGRILRLLGRPDEAVHILLGFYERDKKHVGVVRELGKALAASDSLGKALTVLGRAKQLDPTDISVQSALGIVHDKMGNHALAQGMYRAALVLDPKNVMLLNNLGLSFALSGNLDIALDTLRKASSYEDAGPEVSQNIALVLAAKGDLEKAGEILKEGATPENIKNNRQFLEDNFAPDNPE